MKITKIECFPVSLKFAKPVVMSGGAEAASHVVVVKIHTDEGVIGVSETGDTSSGIWVKARTPLCITSIKSTGRRILLGEDPFKIEKIVATHG